MRCPAGALGPGVARSNRLLAGSRSDLLVTEHSARQVVKRVAPPLVCTTKHTLFINFGLRTVPRATQDLCGTLASTSMRPSQSILVIF